ncbi:MAG: YitT family protein, partial [Paludibacter sp.]
MKQSKKLVSKNSIKNKKYTFNQFLKLLRDFTFIGLGITSAGFGLKGFLLPNSFIDGGVTGISLILSELTNIPLSILLIAINIPFIFMALTTV